MTKKKKKTPSTDDGSRLILRNKRATYEYRIIERLECGMVLTGTEVKSLRDNAVSFADSYAVVRDDELLLIGLNISEYRMGTHGNHPATRTRKLLAHKRQIRKLKAAVQEKGNTLIPLALLWRRGLAKIEIGLARGKAEYDKRETIKKRDFDKHKQRLMRR